MHVQCVGSRADFSQKCISKDNEASIDKTVYRDNHISGPATIPSSVLLGEVERYLHHLEGEELEFMVDRLGCHSEVIINSEDCVRGLNLSNLESFLRISVEQTLERNGFAVVLYFYFQETKMVQDPAAVLFLKFPRNNAASILGSLWGTQTILGLFGGPKQSRVSLGDPNNLGSLWGTHTILGSEQLLPKGFRRPL